jgi:hypothetical protein
MSTTHSFNLIKILFPSFDCIYLKDPGPNAKFNQGFRIYVDILTDTRARISFGFRLESAEKGTDGLPVVHCGVDAMAEVEFPTPLPKDMSTINQIPLLANILAMLFPFVREKVNYFLSNNFILLMIPPINTFEVIKELETKKNNRTILDHRKEATITSP